MKLNIHIGLANFYLVIPPNKREIHIMTILYKAYALKFN